MRSCERARICGRIGYAEAFELQRISSISASAARFPISFCSWSIRTSLRWAATGTWKTCWQRGRAPRAGVAFHQTDRGGDITYHGPGQIVGYPIFDLRDWKRDVGAYVRAIEQVLIDALADFGIAGGRDHGRTGVWVDGSENRRHRCAYQPLGDIPWLRAECHTPI